MVVPDRHGEGAGDAVAAAVPRAAGHRRHTDGEGEAAGGTAREVGQRAVVTGRDGDGHALLEPVGLPAGNEL